MKGQVHLCLLGPRPFHGGSRGQSVSASCIKATEPGNCSSNIMKKNKKFSLAFRTNQLYDKKYKSRIFLCFHSAHELSNHLELDSSTRIALSTSPSTRISTRDASCSSYPIAWTKKTAMPFFKLWCRTIRTLSCSMPASSDAKPFLSSLVSTSLVPCAKRSCAAFWSTSAFFFRASSAALEAVGVPKEGRKLAIPPLPD